MASIYLELAEEVLLLERKPLSARELVQHARLRDLVPVHLRGATPHKTLHARLSEDIAKHPHSSPFFRTAPGRFFLKSLAADPTAPEAFRKIHPAPPRQKELRQDLVLGVNTGALEADATGSIRASRLRDVFSEGHFAYMPWKALRASSEFLPVHSFVVVRQGSYALSYRRGRFRPGADPLFSPRSIGFGGVVFASDLELLFDSFQGIVENAIRELVHSIGLSGRLADDARYSAQVKPVVGILSETEKATQFDVVLSYECPEEFSPAKTALSSNDLRWISLVTPPNDLTNYDGTSRTLFDLGWARNLSG